MDHRFHTGRRHGSEGLSAARRTTRRRIEWIVGQVVESLEPLALLSTGCPTISGYVFVDENSANPALTNNGLFDPGETPITGASVELLNSSDNTVATTTTDSTGAYSFGGMNPNSPTTPVTITQTITVGDPANPNLPTNYTGQAFSPALSLFDPSLGTLQSVQVSSDVVYDSTITLTNLSEVSPATGVQASISGDYQVDGLGPTLTISGNPTKSGSGADLPGNRSTPGPPPSDTIDLTAEDKQDPVLTSAQDLAFFTAGSGQTSITPTMTATGSGTASASNGNGTVTQSTFAAATMTITYTYIPAAECLIEPGTYSIVQTPEVSGYINGKESQQGTVLAPNGPPQMLSVTIPDENTNSIDNDFAKLTPPPPPPPPPSPTPTLSSLAPPPPPPPSPTPTLSPSAPPAVSAITIAPPGMTTPQNLSPATPSGITRFGVHHQPTKLLVRYVGAVNPVQAENVNNYSITARGSAGRFGVPGNLHYKVSSAIYDASTNAVLLTSARRLNLHDHFELTIELGPISPGGNGKETTMLFGGEQILGGFVGNHGHGTALRPLRLHHNQIGIRAAPSVSLGRSGGVGRTAAQVHGDGHQLGKQVREHFRNNGSRRSRPVIPAGHACTRISSLQPAITWAAAPGTSIRAVLHGPCS